RGPLEALLETVGTALGRRVVAKGESKLLGRMGKPDYAILADDLLAGYLELKAPGSGAEPRRFKGHDREQWERFRSLPNLLYSDGNEWGLYQGGAAGHMVRLVGDIACDGKDAVAAEDAAALSN